eukprot:TRINITY_DN3500_c0_g3_i1.p1 TRINITY_DN3500_c0_g3~~TRINITY_DN3500_c0_g3_i1.p1  ORF type:complete len:488 (+),score=91.45 TRINITY_DN3500_c0_g3_i1:106-1569(+)
MLSSVIWVAKGIAASLPQTIDLTEQEKSQFLASAQQYQLPTEEKTNQDQNTKIDAVNPDIIKEYNLDDYDNENEDAFLQEDSNMDLKYEMDSDDIEEEMIRPTDNLIVSTLVQEDISTLQVLVYDPEREHAYIHHDYVLSSYPLCLSWHGYHSKKEDKKGNLVAVGTFEPGIEIWDLDVLDAPLPTFVLGGPKDLNNMYSQGSHELTPDSHKDAVLGLSWNSVQSNVVGSCSADKSIKVWDLETLKCLATFNKHKDKVQTVSWYHEESSIIASGGFDNHVYIFDVRNHAAAIHLEFEHCIESIRWIPWNVKNHVLVSCENGMIYCYDLANYKQPLFRLAAHSDACQALALDPLTPGLLASGSPEKSDSLKLWNITDYKPSCIYSNSESDMGPIFGLNFNPDVRGILSIANQPERKNVIPRVFNAFTLSATRQAFNKNSFVVQESTSDQGATVDIFKDSVDVVEDVPARPSNRPKKKSGARKKNRKFR